MAKRVDFRPEKVRDLPEGTPFVMIGQAMLESPAWSVLGINHRRLLDFLMIEHMANAGLENGRLKAPRNQLEAFGIPRRFIGSTIAETEALGFVDVVDPGMRGNIVQGRPGLYALTFVRVATVDDFGRTIFAEPSHRYLSITTEDAYRIVGKEPPARVLNSSSKVAKVTPNLGHIEQNSRVTIDPSAMAETAEVCGSAKGSKVTQPSISRLGGVGVALPTAGRQHASASASTSSAGRDDCQGLAPSPVQPVATARPPEAIQQAPGAPSSADLELPLSTGERQRTPTSSAFLRVREDNPEIWTFVAGKRRGGMIAPWAAAVRREEPPALLVDRVDHENVIVCARAAMAFDLEFKQRIERLGIVSGKTISDAGKNIIRARQAGNAPADRWTMPGRGDDIVRLHDVLTADDTSIYSDPTSFMPGRGPHEPRHPQPVPPAAAPPGTRRAPPLPALGGAVAHRSADGPPDVEPRPRPPPGARPRPAT